MDDVALANYQAGIDFGNVEAGRLDRACADLLGLAIGTPIWFSDYTFLKLRQRHGEINFSHYRNMPSILLHGFLARGRHSNLLDFWWIKSRDENPSGFFVVLKATKKAEVFVETFHPIHLREGRRLFKRAIAEKRIIRVQARADDLLKIGKDHLRKKLKA